MNRIDDIIAIFLGLSNGVDKGEQDKDGQIKQEKILKEITSRFELTPFEKFFLVPILSKMMVSGDIDFNGEKFIYTGTKTIDQENLHKFEIPRDCCIGHFNESAGFFHFFVEGILDPKDFKPHSSRENVIPFPVSDKIH